MPNPIHPTVISRPRLLRPRNLSSLSSLVHRGGRGICCFLALATLLSRPATSQVPARPHIFAIRQVEIHISDKEASKKFYGAVGHVVGECIGCENSAPSIWLRLPTEQRVLLWNSSSLQRPSSPKSSLLSSLGFEVDSVERMASFLRANGISFERIYPVDGDPELVVADPEGREIRFIQPEPSPMNPGKAVTRKPVPLRLIHAGFIVHDRAAMEHFYKDILCFRPYWHGGMKDDETNWVSLQVPDGSDWLEFMLYDPTGKDKRFLGIMNHIALGVKDIHAAQEQLRKNGAPLTEEPKIGRDGKWQLNLYDPDLTRIEFMEFTPVQKPCCSEFTVPHPKP